tara:strand:- start:15 stop:434 length:420 start_codon:yes stop_codon:yes gene_type:complete
MSAQQLVSVMGKNTQVNPMLMKNDMSFVQSLYDTGIAPLQGPITNKNKDMFQNQERIQGMIDLKNYTIFMNENTTTDLNLLLNPDQNYQILVNNTNAPGPGTDITVTILGNGPTSGGSCDVLAAAARMIFFTNGVFICP